MNAPHRLGKLDVEIAATDAVASAELRARIEHVVRTLLPGSIERICDELAPADRITRLGRIDLDLGTIDAEGIQGLPALFESALAEALAQALDGEGRLAP